MRLHVLLTTVAVGAVAATPAAAASPRVETMVVGPRAVLWDAHTVIASPAHVRVGGRSCRVRGGSALAALAAARRRGGPAFSVTRDCAVPYVPRIGRFAARGPDGWVYKVGRTAPTISAGAPLRAIRPGARVLWFWCALGPGGCERTLEVTPAVTRVAPGARLPVTVTGYDDFGRGRRIAGATVRLGSAWVRTDRRGRAVLTAPSQAGGALLRAARRGLVPAFPVPVAVR